jgi:eukaryotic-like serine/threonine-protein kinase
MSLPRLRADLRDGPAIARVLNCAIRHESQIVPLKAPPTSGGQHVLEVDVPGEGLVMLLAEIGSARAEGQELGLRPLTRPQMADLFAIVERLAAPSMTERPSAVSSLPFGSISEPPPDMTVFEIPKTRSGAAGGVVVTDPPRAFGVIDSIVAGPPSSTDSSNPFAMPMPEIPRGDEDVVMLDPHIGRVIAGKYSIETAIGAGSTASVYRAQHVDLKRAVAVKILDQQKLGNEQFVKRFKAEAFAASKLEHINIARVIDFGHEEDGLLYLVMELLTGKSLEAILQVKGRLPQRKAVEVAMQACTGLAFAHDDGIIHRDVKPENLMLVTHRDDDGKPCDIVKVCDFGLAKLRDVDPSSEHADLTTVGMLCGSPAYMSPEQTRGDVLDARTDVYSVGVTLFEALTGELPHQAGDLAQLFLKKMLEPPRRPSSLLADIDPLLEKILLRSMATDRTARHANARVLREELRQVLASLPVPTL